MLNEIRGIAYKAIHDEESDTIKALMEIELKCGIELEKQESQRLRGLIAVMDKAAREGSKVCPSCGQENTTPHRPGCPITEACRIWHERQR